MTKDGKPVEKVGEGLIRIGAMTSDQVKEVLRKQREKHGHDKLFGEIAVELEFVDEATIESFFDKP